MIVAYVYNNNPKSKFFGQIGWCHLNAEGGLRIAPVYVRYKFRKTMADIIKLWVYKLTTIFLS